MAPGVAYGCPDPCRRAASRNRRVRLEAGHARAYRCRSPSISVPSGPKAAEVIVTPGLRPAFRLLGEGRREHPVWMFTAMSSPVRRAQPPPHRSAAAVPIRSGVGSARQVAGKSFILSLTTLGAASSALYSASHVAADFDPDPDAMPVGVPTDKARHAARKALLDSWRPSAPVFAPSTPCSRSPWS